MLYITGIRFLIADNAVGSGGGGLGGLNTLLTLIGELRNSSKAKNVSCFESFDFFNRRLI